MEEDVINSKQLDKHSRDSNEKDVMFSSPKIRNSGLRESVFECMKMLTNKASFPLVGQLFQSKLSPEYTLNEVAKHHDATSCWIVVSDKVYDVTEFLNEHPGGEEIILENAGTDTTGPYLSKGHSKHADDLLEKYYIGELVKEDRRHKT